MARSITEIEKELLALPSQARERIARDLIISLDKADEQLPQQEWDAAWQEEIQKRVDDIDSGNVTLFSHNEVMNSLKAITKK